MKGPMPVARDVRVAPKPPAVEEPSASESKAAPCMVTVMGFDNKDVLFRSDDVGAVQWRDSGGKIVALLARIKPDIWGFSKRGDNDWEEVLKIFGNPE